MSLIKWFEGQPYVSLQALLDEARKTTVSNPKVVNEDKPEPYAGMATDAQKKYVGDLTAAKQLNMLPEAQRNYLLAGNYEKMTSKQAHTIINILKNQKDKVAVVVNNSNNTQTDEIPF
jgi:hypothetical protein